MPEVVIATRNEGKLTEIRAILGRSVNVVSLAAYPDAPKVVEDGDTFEANAVKKAVAVARHTGEVALADDSGLAVDALEGAPGIYSARFAGEDASDEANNAKLLALLADVPDERRTARFRCAIAVARPDGTHDTVSASWEGPIARELRGANGFGYDPLFLSDAHGLTSAELPSDEKNKASHRGQALARAVPLIRACLA